MRRRPRHLRSLLACLALVACTFPASAFAWPGEFIWDHVKDGLEELVDYGSGVAEVQWEGAYGAGCFIKNVATWNGRSCSTSVEDSGQAFRSLLADVDECAASFDPTGALGIGAAQTAGADTLDREMMTRSDVQQLLDAATGEQGFAASQASNIAKKTGATEWLKSAGARRAILRNPMWLKVSSRIPFASKLLILYSLANNCTSAMEFAVHGPDYLISGKVTWKKIDGVWHTCTTTCVRTDPPDQRTDEERLRQRVCGQVVSARGSSFDYESYCDERMTEQAAACRSGTSHLAADLCTQLTGATTVRTTSTPLPGGSTSTQSLDARSVPGGSVDGSCAQVLRSIAEARSTGSYGAATVASCTGTTDTACQVLRARASIGHAVFPLAADVHQRCFG